MTINHRDNMYPINIIVAVDLDGGFAKNGKIPWVDEEWAKKDLKNFKKVTTGSVCIMGRHTYTDMLDMVTARGKKVKDIKEILPGRESFVVTKDSNMKTPGASVAQNMRSIITSLDANDKREVFIIGGERMYIEAFNWTRKVYMTLIDKHYSCDKFFPIKELRKFEIVNGEQHEHFKLLTYQRNKW